MGVPSRIECLCSGFLLKVQEEYGRQNGSWEQYDWPRYAGSIERNSSITKVPFKSLEIMFRESTRLGRTVSRICKRIYVATRKSLFKLGSNGSRELRKILVSQLLLDFKRALFFDLGIREPGRN